MPLPQVIDDTFSAAPVLRRRRRDISRTDAFFAPLVARVARPMPTFRSTDERGRASKDTFFKSWIDGGGGKKGWQK